jgi:ElaB/YqjD/DUF883 family membrane-anchored ribosome-binding protein
MATAQQPNHPPTPESAAAGPMHAAIDHATQAASSAGQHVNDSLAAAREAIGHCVDEACLLGSECADSTRSAVRTRPLTALVAALGIGLLIGRLCR